MRYRFIKFNDEQLDAKQVMMLQDLARLLLKNEQTKVKIQKFPYYDPINNTLITSWFWSHRPKDIESAGLKQMLCSLHMVYKMMDEAIIMKSFMTMNLAIPNFIINSLDC